MAIADTEPVVPAFVMAEGSEPESLLPRERETVVRIANEMITEAQVGQAWLGSPSARPFLDDMDEEGVRELLRDTVTIASRYKVAYGKLDEALAWLQSGELSQQIRTRELDARNNGWRIRLAELEVKIRAVFPTECAEVRLNNTPWSKLGESLPPVKRWQRQVGIDRAEVADGQYIAHMQGVRAGVLTALQRLKGEPVERYSSWDEQDELMDQFAAEPLLRIMHAQRAIFVENIVLAQQSSLRDKVRYEGNTVMISAMRRESLEHLGDAVGSIDTLLPSDSASSFSTLLERVTGDSRDNLRDAGAAVADQMCYELMEEALELLREKLSSATMQPERVSIKGVASTAKRRQQSPSPRQLLAVDMSQQAEGQGELKAIAMPREVVGWLDREEGERLIYNTVEGGNGSVFVVDCQTEAMKSIANSSAYDLEFEENKLMHAARMIATSREGKLSGMKVVRNAGPEYNFPIMYPHKRGPNATRVYMSQIPLSAFAEASPEVHEALKRSGVHSVLAHIGTCDKAHQFDMLNKLTGEARRVISAQGGGSV